MSYNDARVFKFWLGIADMIYYSARKAKLKQKAAEDISKRGKGLGRKSQPDEYHTSPFHDC